MKLQFSLATLLVCIPMRIAVAVAFRWQTDMRRRSTIVFTGTMLALALFLSSDAEAQDTSTQRDNPKVILEGKVIDDQVVDERGKLIAGAITVRAMYAQQSRWIMIRPRRMYDGQRRHVQTLAQGVPLILLATTSDGRQVGIVRVAADQSEVTIRVGPLREPPVTWSIERKACDAGLHYVWHTHSRSDQGTLHVFSGGERSWIRRAIHLDGPGTWRALFIVGYVPRGIGLR